MEITELLARARSIEINISPRDGQINISMPWDINSVPDPAKEILREIKKNRSQLMGYFALNSNPVDIKLLINALKLQGVRIAPDNNTGFKMFITKDAPGRCNGTAIKLINLLNYHRHMVIDYLAVQGEKQQPG
ncbi:hypothetical protein [Desulforamulus reducens]|nr:hypothetical protein [Desulforamulus reducens]